MSTNTHNAKWRESINDRQRQQQEELLEALRENHIIQRACRRMGISRSTLYRWMEEDEGFKARVEAAQKHGIETTGDFVESGLLQRIQEGDLGAIKFFLNHRHPAYQQKTIFERDRMRQEDEARFRRNVLEFTISLVKQLGLKPHQIREELGREIIAVLMGVDISKIEREIMNIENENEEIEKHLKKILEERSGKS